MPSFPLGTPFRLASLQFRGRPDVPAEALYWRARRTENGNPTQMNPATPTRRARLPEPLLWAVLALLLTIGMLVLRPTTLSNDSYQYLDVANNLRLGRGIVTTLIYFDTERSHGLMPAPLTTFPPGYPAAVAAASLGGDLEAAGRLVSVVSCALTAGLLAWGVMLLKVRPAFRPFLPFLFVTNADVLRAATSVSTEPLFMLLCVGAVVGLIRAEERKVSPLTLPGFVLAGLACWVRYAGYFLIAGIVAYEFLQLLVEGKDGRSRRLAFLAMTSVPIALAATLLARNMVTVGSWRGGNDMVVHNGLGRMAVQYLLSQVHLLLGGHAMAYGVPEVLLLMGGISAAFAVAAASRRGGVPLLRSPGRTISQAGTLLATICVLVYSAGIVYAGLRTSISF